LDLQRLVRFGKPSVDVPKTALEVSLKAHGTTRRPVADFSIQGWSERKRMVINRIHYHGDLHYGEERARGQFAITAVDESVKGKLDLPVVLTGERPVSL